MTRHRNMAARTLLRVAGRASVMAVMMGSTAFAQSAQPGAGIYLGTLEFGTVADELRDQIRDTAGAADVVGADEISAIPTPTFSQAMTGVPGVVVQDFFGGNDQPRFQIRGSGMQQSPTERGLLVLQNGMPVNLADGSYIAGLAAPGFADAIEIWRGASANRLGASVLGGAVNFISPTASSSPGSKLSFGGGSHESLSASAQHAIQGDTHGAMLQFEHSQSEGWRQGNNDNTRTVIGANVEFEHDNGNATQVFMSYTDLSFGVPGPVLKSDLAADPSVIHGGPVFVGGAPTKPGPNVPRDLPRREATQLLAGVRTTLAMGDHRFDLGASASKTDDSFRFPIAAGERVTDGSDGNLSLRYGFRPNSVGHLPLIEATLNYAFGSADRAYYHNVSGARGPQFGANDLSATTLSAHIGANFALGDHLTLSPSISYTRATRDNVDLWAAATRPTVGFHPVKERRLPDGSVPTVSNSYARTYEGWSPKIDLTWRPNENNLLWISASHSFEPPTHNDLLATTGGTPFSGPGRPKPPMPTSNAPAFSTAALKAQEADTIEIGWRGRRGDLAWDVTAYHSWVSNEILSLRDETASPRASFNADKTIHTGIEAGLSGRISDRLSGRLAWTWQDFRFDDDPLRGNNRLGGAPSHVISAALAWQATDRLLLTGTAKWVPEKTPVDNMNTVFNDPYFVADLRAQYAINDTVSIVGEITNIFDEKYAGSTLVVDQARPDQAAFIPGQGRSFYIGTQFEF